MNVIHKKHGQNIKQWILKLEIKYIKFKLVNFDPNQILLPYWVQVCI